jgi:hypothetical protein
MWAQYRKTFLGIQVVIAVVTCMALFATGDRVATAAVLFAVMQVCAVLGAMWAVRLKGKLALHR